MNTKPLILVVDDNESTLRSTSVMLGHAGFEVREAKNGLTCLDSMREKLPDLVLLDVQLPDIDGLEVCRLIKSDEALAPAFVVHYSAVYTTSDEQSAGLEGGADGYLVRPLQSRELLARLHAFLRHKKTIDSLRKALDEISTLQGLIPICAHCKKIRDDKGFWSNVEVYLAKHSDLTFTHGVCPDCAAQFHEDLKRLTKEQGRA